MHEPLDKRIAPPFETSDCSATTLEIGRRKADEILARRTVARARRAQALATHTAKLELRVHLATPSGPLASASLETAGFLVAAGDSWFDYPFHDVLKLLEDDYGYNVESAAHRGDPIEAMAYQGGQLDKFTRGVEKVMAHGVNPKAVLLSGGGDDIAGSEFGMLLNNATSDIGGWNSEIVDGVINQRIARAYRSILTSITHICQQQVGRVLPILVHGYDYPVPDGRGFFGGWPLPGPWLQPGFGEKRFTDLATNVALMHEIIDRFNNMLVTLSGDPGFHNVHYIDLRGTLSTELAGNTYQQWWGNELHPTEKGFSTVTGKFADKLRSLP